MFKNLFTTKTATKKKVDFSNLFANKVETPKPRIFKLNESLGGGSFNVGNAGELVKTDRGYAGIEAPGEYREHIFPVSLGGTSETDNIKVYGKDLGEKKSKYENDIIRQYKAGKISLNEARGLVLKKFRELTGLDPKQGTANYLWEGLKSTLAIPFKRSAEKTREKQKKAIESVDIKDKRSQLFSYFGKQRTMINPAVSIMPIKMPKEYTQDDIAKMGAEEIEKLYSQIYKTEASAKQETTMELVSAVLPTAAKLPGEIVKLGNINKIKQGIKETPEVIDLRGTEMIEPKKVGRITEQGFEPVKVEQTVAKTVEAPKKELNLDAFKKSVKKQEPIVQEIKKAKAEGKSFDEFVKAQGTFVYRGGDTALDTSRGSGRGISVSDKETAGLFTPPKGGVVDEAILPKTAKILKESDIPKNLQDAYIKKAKVLADPNNFSKKLQQSVIDKQQAIIDYARKNGFDAVEFPFEKEIRVIKPNVLKTKSQLKQLWDTAEIQAPKVEKPIVYKPIEKPVKSTKEITYEPISKPKESFDGKVIDTTAQKGESFSRNWERVKEDFGFNLDPIEFQRTTNKKQIEKAFNYIQRNPQKAMRIAYGLENAPEGQSVAAIRRSLRVSLLDAGKKLQAEEVGKLLSKEFTAAGQTINIAKLDAGANRLINDITKARLKKIGEKLGAKPDEALATARKKVKTEAKVAGREVVEQTEKQLREIRFSAINAEISKLIC